MSAILPSGILFLVGAVLTLGFGAASLLFGLTLGLILPHAADASLWERLCRFVPAPLFCIVVGGVGFVLGAGNIKGIDYLCFACPMIGLGVGAFIASRWERRYCARNPQREQHVSRTVVIAALLFAGVSVCAAIAWQRVY